MRSKKKRQRLSLEMETSRVMRARIIWSSELRRLVSCVYEIDAKEAATHCGIPRNGNTRQMWSYLWNGIEVTTV
jgi:hypothetical protein